MKRSPAASLLVLLSVVLAQPITGQSIEIPSIRSSALGGTHAALADDIDILVSNPAGFRLAGPEISISELALWLTGPVFSIADLGVRIAGGSSPATLVADPSVQALLNGLHAVGNLGGPLAFGYVGNGLGFGFWNTSVVRFDTVGTIPTVTASVEEEILFAGGYAFRIPLPESFRSTLDIGAELKAFLTGTVGLQKSILEMLSLLSSPSLAILLDQPLDLTVGIGVDAGILYQWNTLIAVGIAGRNLWAPTLVNTYPSLNGFLSGAAPAVALGSPLPLDLSAGIAFTPRLGGLERYVSRLKVLLDYNDILDFLTHPATARNPVLHLGFGAEATLLGILALRGGFGDGYFSAGLGLDLTIFRLDLAMFGAELSTEPGIRPAFNLLLGIAFTL